MSLAYNSVLQLSFEVRAGLVMRQTHHWSALLFMAAIVAHMIRVFFTGAFRKPREMSWLMGVGLVTAGIGAGFTGYSLPDDLLSGVGLRIAYSIAQSIPFVGQWLANMFFGGEFPGDALLPRLLTLHIFVIPLVILAMMSTHLAVVWHQTHTQFKGPGRAEDTVTGTPVWPKFVLKSIGLAFVTFGTLTLMGGRVPDQPGVVLRAVRALHGTVALPARLVRGMAGRPAPAVAQLGVHDLRRHDRGAVPARHRGARHHVHAARDVAVPGGEVLRATTSGTTSPRSPTKRRCGARSAPPRSRLMVVLFLAGSNDVLAKYLQIEVDTFNTLLKVLVFVLPVVVGVLTFKVCRDLRDRPRRPIDRPSTMTVRRTEDGGFEEIHEPGSHDEVDAP